MFKGVSIVTLLLLLTLQFFINKCPNDEETQITEYQWTRLCVCVLMTPFSNTCWNNVV